MSSRYVYAAAAILLLSAAYGCWCQAPLIWDGAYQFDMTLALQRPYVYLTRFHTFFLWYPTVWASRMTSNTNVLQAIYGLPFLLAPVTGLLLSWWIVRKAAPQLIVWVIFGIVVTVPGQIFVINDSFFQLHLFWPLFVAMFVPLTWTQRIVLAILAVFQLVHPLGVPLTFGAAVAGALVATADRQNRHRLLLKAGVMAVLCLLAISKIEIANHSRQWVDKYAQDEATWANAQARWRASVSGTPLHGLTWIWIAATATFLQPPLWRRSRRLAIAAGVVAVLCVGRAASYWLYWAHGPVCLWGGAIDYRRWVGPLAAPFCILATAEMAIAAFRRRSLDETARSSASFSIRGPIAVLCALLFAITLGLQYTTWHERTRQLMVAVRNYPTVIVPNTDPALDFVDHSPLAHWATGNYVSAALGKQPSKMFLDEETEKIIRAKYFDPSIREADRAKMGWFYYATQPDSPPGSAGWFDFRPALAQARNEQALHSRREQGKILNGIP